jgi:hypothetical protein
MRDFAHLAITLWRCMNIPARYCTGYLGDIGVPPDPAPMDFSAWFEVYLGDRWYTFDARHNKPRIGRILMARGRDAAIVTSFGPCTLAGFKVITEESGDQHARFKTGAPNEREAHPPAVSTFARKHERAPVPARDAKRKHFHGRPHELNFYPHVFHLAPALVRFSDHQPVLIEFGWAFTLRSSGYSALVNASVPPRSL